MRRMKRFLADSAPSVLAGAFFSLALFRGEGDEGGRLGALILGALYGLSVLGLLRLFRTRSFGYLVAGMIAGPVPMALLLPAPLPEAERGGAWLVTALLGFCVGALEWARVRSAAPADAPRAG